MTRQGRNKSRVLQSEWSKRKKLELEFYVTFKAVYDPLTHTLKLDKKPLRILNQRPA